MDAGFISLVNVPNLLLRAKGSTIEPSPFSRLVRSVLIGGIEKVLGEGMAQMREIVGLFAIQECHDLRCILHAEFPLPTLAVSGGDCGPFFDTGVGSFPHTAELILDSLRDGVANVVPGVEGFAGFRYRDEGGRLVDS